MTTIFIAKASDGAHAIRLSSRDADTFKMLIEGLKDYVPASHRVYVPDRKTWRVDADAHAELHAWLSDARSTFHARIEWLGGEIDADQEREWTPPKRARPKPVDPYQALHLLPSAPPELVKVAYRCLAQIHHPDKGGDTATMQRINDAFKMLAA
jgi:hypothetical protein